MAEYHKTAKDLTEHLRQSCEAIDHLIDGYNAGKIALAAPLAQQVNALVYDPTPSGRKSRPTQSLLGQMGTKDTIQYLSTRKSLPRTVIPWVPLAWMRADEIKNWQFVPTFDSAKEDWKWMTFRQWWTEPVFQNPEGKSLTRMNLVRSMRDQDGGGHIDTVLTDAEYVLLRQIVDPRVVRMKNFQPGPGNKPEIKFYLSLDEARQKTQPNEEPIPGAHFATMCQIAWELRQSVAELIQ